MSSFLRHFFARTLVALLATIGITTFAAAQTITGSLRGSVTDQSGAAVSGANLTATNTATGVMSSTTSDRSGLYNFQFLPIGSYTVTALAPGFRTVHVGPLSLEIDQIVQVNVKLRWEPYLPR